MTEAGKKALLGAAAAGILGAALAASPASAGDKKAAPTAAQWTALQAIRGGGSLAAVCQAVESLGRFAAAPGQVQRRFSDWIVSGVIKRVEINHGL